MDFLRKKTEKHAKEHNLEKTQYKDWQFDILSKILSGIHKSMTRITSGKDRHAKSVGVFSVENEYDLQNLIWTVLKPNFPEMVDEVPIPKHMGEPSRVDFYIPEIKTIIELKHVRENNQAKKIPSDLDHDLTWYAKFVEAEKLVFYVFKNGDVTFDFEPMKASLNQKIFSRDSKTWESVTCIVRPE